MQAFLRTGFGTGTRRKPKTAKALSPLSHAAPPRNPASAFGFDPTDFELAESKAAGKRYYTFPCSSSAAHANAVCIPAVTSEVVLVSPDSGFLSIRAH